MEFGCKQSWGIYRELNRISWERRAAVVSCNKAREIAGANCGKSTQSSKDCCKVARAEAAHLCKNMDPKAKIECCPFKNNGELNGDCLKHLIKVYLGKKGKK